MLHHLVQHAADGAELAGRSVRGAKLAEDLRLADDHRLQPGRDPEQVLDRRAGVVHEEVVAELVGADGRPLEDVKRRGPVGQADREEAHLIVLPRGPPVLSPA